MATFLKRGDLQWQAKIRRKGFSSQTKTFNARADAESWARQLENEMDRGVFLSRKEAGSTTLTEALDRYESEVSSLKKGYPQKRKRIRQWGMEGILNPVRSIRLPKPSEARDRRIIKQELESLLQEAPCPYREIFQFAIETGMRRGEIAAIQWEHVNLKKRTLSIPETKTGKSRIVPLSNIATELLFTIDRRIDGTVWGVAPDSISHAFADACKKANIEDLRFHDLRHEATSRFFEHRLNVMEVSSITGHQTLQMLRRYTHLKAEDLVKKLDGKSLANH
jgi:integrase